MAVYFREFCVGWTVYLLCLFIIEPASLLQDELYYRYNTLDSSHRSVAELNFDFIEENVHHSRHRRNVDDLDRSHIPLLKSFVNSTFQNSQSSNSASSNNKPSTLSSGNVNSNLHSDTSQDVATGGPSHMDPSSHAEFNRLQTLKQAVRVGSVQLTPSDPSSVGGVNHMDPLSHAEFNRLQTLKQAARLGNVQLTTSETSSVGTPTNVSVKIPNNPPIAKQNAGQIVSATFEASTKITNVSGNSGDPLRDKDTDISINQFPEEITNATLKEENITRALKDNHIYYNSTFIVDEKIGQQYWVELANNSDVKIHDMLSQSHRRAATVQLSFDFPFYGYLVTNITIATGGFLFTGDHIHSWLAATQYIAPLMANFDNRISDDSFVKYLDNGTAFIVLWENVVLKDSPEFGNFTFEAILHKNGDIVFIYKSIPVAVENIRDDQHPVKVGLSDAYIIDRTIFFVKRKTIYEYHRVNFSKEDIKNWTVIYLNALPTCHDMKDCETCVNANINLECKWCPAVERCSTGLDRARQEWLAHECDKVRTTLCNEPPPPPYAHKAAEDSIVNTKPNGPRPDKGRIGASGVISMLLIMTSLAAAAFIFLYAYRNPHSTPGQLLIRYRPSQWRWRRGEARYTAATIHM